MNRLLLVVCLVLPGVTAGADAPSTGRAVAVQPDAYPLIEKLHKERKFDEALAAATKATADNPRSAQAFFLLGKTHFYLEKDAPARAALSTAIELRPDFAAAYFFRGLTFNYSPASGKAGPDFKKAAELDPAKALYWYELGKYNERQGLVDHATPALERAAALDPGMASAWFALGTIASDKSDFQRAATMWEKAIAAEPKHVNAHYNLGQHHQVRGDAKASLFHFLAALEHKPGEVETVKKVVQAYYRLAEYDKAAVYRLQLLELVATSSDPRIGSLKEVCFDQFDVPGGRYFVYETLSKEGSLVYWYRFKLVNQAGDIVKTINLETSDGLKESGKTMFLLGQTKGNVHTNFGIGFAQLPAYPELKELVLKAHNGQLKAAASTTFGKK